MTPITSGASLTAESEALHRKVHDAEWHRMQHTCESFDILPFQPCTCGIDNDLAAIEAAAAAAALAASQEVTR